MKRTFIVVAVVCALVGVAACSSPKPKTAPTPAATDLRGRKQVDVAARQNQFTPVSIIIDVGTTVTWHNQDAVVHNVKKSADAVDFGGQFGDNALNPGGTYAFTFAKAGTFFYTCTIHAAMTGKVEVVAKA